MFVQRCNEYELQKLYETAQEASEIIKKTNQFFILFSQYLTETPSTPKPYLILLDKLIEEASEKYFVGQVISAISKPFSKI
mgnify:CR=1 FL=1